MLHDEDARNQREAALFAAQFKAPATLLPKNVVKGATAGTPPSTISAVPQPATAALEASMAELQRVLEAWHTDLLVMAPPCGPWLSLQNLNEPDQVIAEQAEHYPCGRWSARAGAARRRRAAWR